MKPSLSDTAKAAAVIFLLIATGYLSNISLWLPILFAISGGIALSHWFEVRR